MPIVYVTPVELEYLDKIKKLDIDEKEKINQIIDTYLESKKTTI